ncbi:YidC/Oxa1 family membrane protein insertase [Altererythrobacter atlanticus]|uniref:Membrane protein insertase YidC n=1 Tax=Croceibacterium atlanticum TaxID=1267766 RepID=A0A0F7KVB7_9SPHN|nr:membrane protein insertase YidC [Croceibacterium atlanticum]AKH42700.1 Membrane protein insertase YidC [Croceibacterium atlanticum]MBB5731477.1 YidC/Oxa1 family membrane protein insertase [Croceibacterium atlanticum]
MENRNLVLAVVLSLVLFLGYEVAMSQFYPQSDQAPTEELAQNGTDTPAQRAAATHIRDGGLTDPAEQAEEVRDLETALATAERVRIDAPEVAGSINPVGARIDDIVLKTHRQTVDKDSGPVRLFSPSGTPAQQFAQFGWIGEGVKLPGANTVWQAEGGPLAPGNPVTLTWDNGEGQVFTIRFSIDEFYMLTADQSVINNAEGSVALRPYAFINRTSRTASSDMWNLHSGPIGNFGGEVNFSWDYDDVAEAGSVRNATPTGWVGFTDIYWLSALIPQAGTETQTEFRTAGGEHYRADLLYDAVTVGSGETASRSTQLFAGAKESAVLDHYEDAGVENFGLAIDWGWFRWFMKPIFWLLRELYALTGNFGVAIILLTVVIRALMFPIAQKQFASMAQMRAVQPKMKALQERHKDDKATLQQEMGKLYREEGVNPLAGCLPIFLQIPIFFALYKTLLVAIEMRHKPFALWIRDLSAPDPAHILNLFGLLDFNPPGFLAIGVLAVLLGFTMWLQFKLNPAAMDPAQQQIFMIMPWVLMFVMAPFAAGLLLYWITSNILTVAQQKYLYSRHPQLKAQMEKDRADKARAAEREKAKE